MDSIGFPKRHTICCGSAKAACTSGLRWFKLPPMSEQTRPNGQAVEQRPTYDKANGQPTTDQPSSKSTDQRVTVADAALLLGLSEDAVRSRLRRGTLRRETSRDGTVFVVLGNDR